MKYETSCRNNTTEMGRLRDNAGRPILLFDFGCILVGLSRQRCIDALEKIGCGRIAYYVDECRQEDLFHELEIGGSIEDFCEEARRQSSEVDKTGEKVPCTATNEEICWAWNELLTGVPVEKLRLIKHLHDDLGYRTAVLSNTNQIHWEKAKKDFFTIDGLTVDDYFDDIFLSCDMGMVKPDKGIFEAVMECLHTQPDNVIFFDDSEKNCVAAERLGIRAIHDPSGTLWMTECSVLTAVDEQQNALDRGRAAIIGNFDGVHKGHQYVIDKLKSLAAKYDYEPVAITFDRHPRALFDASFKPAYLSTVEEKVSMLKEELGGEVAVMPFTRELAALDSKTFMKDVLLDEMGVKLLLLGYDNRFGRRNEEENFESYQRYGKGLGIKVILANPFDVDDVRVSSSYIRKKIMKGNVAEANRCLGRPYSITGTVVEGHQEGRKIGFPTANIIPPSEKIIPANGVYASQVHIDGDATSYRGMTNIGVRPTYHGDGVTIETNIFGFNGDIYGKTITLEFLEKIRDEREFTSPEELRIQIEKDSEQIKKL